MPTSTVADVYDSRTTAHELVTYLHDTARMSYNAIAWLAGCSPTTIRNAYRSPGSGYHLRPILQELVAAAIAEHLQATVTQRLYTLESPVPGESAEKRKARDQRNRFRRILLRVRRCQTPTNSDQMSI